MLPLQRRKAPRLDYRIELECGHIIKVRTSPMNKHARYGCNAALSCGYSLWWVRWWNATQEGFANINTLYQKEKESSEKSPSPSDQ